MSGDTAKTLNDLVDDENEEGVEDAKANDGDEKDVPPKEDGGEEQKPDGDAEEGKQGEDEEAKEKVERPDHIPEKFWDSEKGEFNVDGALKAYGDLEKEMHKLKNPDIPENYEVKIDDEKYPDLDLPEDDPLLVRYKEHAKDKGWTQDRFDEGLEMFIDAMRNQAEIQFQSEVDELGGMEKAKERIGKVKKWAKASFTDETYQ